jgi:hypothetical protein
LQASRLFNRALTSAEVLDLSINGVALADRGASQTPFYTSNFSVNADAITSNAGANLVITGNVDGISGVDDTLRASASADVFFQIGRANLFAGRIGKKVRVLFDYFVESGSGLLFFGIGAAGSKSTIGDNVAIIEGAWQSISLMADITSDFRFVSAFTTATGNTGGTLLSGKSVYFKNYNINPTGLTSELIASNAQSDTGQIFDTSGNKNHALLPASGATVVGRPVSQTREVRWTNTWAGTNELQYIGGVNQAILPANAYIESIVGTVSGATPHDIIVGNGSDTDRYVTITTGLAAGTTSFTLASRTTDGTNLKLTVDPDTNSDMSIAWVISYKTLES